MIVRYLSALVVTLSFLFPSMLVQAASARTNAIPIQAYSTISFYRLNTNYDGLYNKNGAYLKLRTLSDGRLDMSLDRFINRELTTGNFPFVMVVESGRGIDLVTGRSPVYSKLVTIVSPHMARSSGPIYATPLTTLAYELTQLLTPRGSSRNAVFSRFEQMAENVSKTFGFGISSDIDLALDPAAHNETVVMTNEKQMVIEHRAVIEAFTAVISKMATGISQSQLAQYYSTALTKMSRSNSLAGGNARDLLIKLLAYDYFKDKAFNGRAGSEVIPGVKLELFNVAPQTLTVSNMGSTRVASIVDVVKNEALRQGLSASYPSLQIQADLREFQFSSTALSSVSTGTGSVLTKSLSTSNTTQSAGTGSPTVVKAAPYTRVVKQFNPGHYTLMWPKVDISIQAKANSLLNDGIFTGAQGRYLWRELEPTEGRYDFSRIERDLQYLASMGKKLVIQLETRDWGSTAFGFPSYIVSPKYAGGYFRRKSGLAVPKMYNPLVAERFRLLVQALGARFDRNITLEAVVTGETSLGLRDPQNPQAVADYRPGVWRDEIIKSITAARRSFATTNIIVYVNYLDYGSPLLAEIVRHAASQNVGIGGPDLLPHQPAAESDHYHYYSQVAGEVPLGTAVQWGNYEYRNPKTGSRVTIREIVDYGVNKLHLNYFFWAVRRPHFYEQVMPTLKAMNMPINR